MGFIKNREDETRKTKFDIGLPYLVKTIIVDLAVGPPHTLYNYRQR